MYDLGSSGVRRRVLPKSAAAWPKLAAAAAFGGVACGQLAVSVVTRQNGNSLLR